MGEEYTKILAEMSDDIKLQKELNRIFKPSDLDGVTNRGELAMKRISSGTTTSGEVRDLALKIQERTGIDLIKEARLAQMSMDIVGDTRWANLFGIIKDGKNGVIKSALDMGWNLVANKEVVARANTLQFLSNADKNILKKTQAILKATKNPVKPEVLWVLRLKDMNIKNINTIYSQLTKWQPLDAMQKNFLRKIIQKNKQHEKLYNIAPVGEWEHWPIYEGVKDADAEKLLMMMQWGEVRGAYTYKREDVDLMWGDYNLHSDKWYWLKKLVDKHPEVLWKIQKMIDTLPEKERTTNRIRLEDDKSVVVIRLFWNNERKSWLMTAFDKNQ